MNLENPSSDPARRKFIGSCCAAVGATGMLSTMAQLRLTGAVASPGNGTGRAPAHRRRTPRDYKALVCLFLAGGNERQQPRRPRPTPPAYAAYASVTGGRGALALPQSADAPGINPKTLRRRRMGRHARACTPVSLARAPPG